MNLSYIKYLTIITMAFFFTTGCTDDASSSTTTVTEEPPPKVKRRVPAFDAESAYAYIEKQLSFGTRVPNTPPHKACRDWLIEEFKSFGATVIPQDFQAKAYTGDMLNGTNIIAQFNPEKKKRILLGAHWDTRHIAEKDPDVAKQIQPIMGADDGASGVAVLLEIGRQIQKNGLDMGIDMILFDLEDHGESNSDDNLSWCLGSQHWSKNKHVANYKPKYGILLDMVGAKDARFAQEGFSMQVAPQLMNKIWGLANKMNYGKYFVSAAVPGITDDHYFVTTIGRIPMIDIINLPANGKTFGDYHHTHDDDIGVISKETLQASGQVVLAVIYRENNGVF